MRVLYKSLSGHLVCEVRVDVTHVCFTADIWHIWWCNLSGEELLPVDSLEEGVRLNLVDVEAVIWVALKQASQQVSGVGAEAWQDIDVVLGDAAQDLVSTLVALHSLLFKGVDATDHLVSEHAKTPPIDSKAMALRLDHFRSKILRCAAEGVSLSAFQRLLDFA